MTIIFVGMLRAILLMVIIIEVMVIILKLTVTVIEGKVLMVVIYE